MVFYCHEISGPNNKKNMQIIEVLISSTVTSWYISTDFRGEDLTHIKTLDSTAFVCFGCKRRGFFEHIYITYNKLMSITEKKSTSYCITVLDFLSLGCFLVLVFAGDQVMFQLL